MAFWHMSPNNGGINGLCKYIDEREERDKINKQRRKQERNRASKKESKKQESKTEIKERKKRTVRKEERCMRHGPVALTITKPATERMYVYVPTNQR